MESDENDGNVETIGLGRHWYAHGWYPDGQLVYGVKRNNWRKSGVHWVKSVGRRGSAMTGES